MQISQVPEISTVFLKETDFITDVARVEEKEDAKKVLKAERVKVQSIKIHAKSDMVVKS